MEKTTDPIKSMLTILKEDLFFINNPTEQEIKILPQMPIEQINFFVNQAITQSKQLTIQLNPSKYTQQITEVSGYINTSPNTQHIILNSKDSALVYLIQNHSIRHIRLS